MEFPNTKLTATIPKRSFSTKAIRAIIKNANLKFWDGYGGLNEEALDELISELQALKEVA